MLKKLIAFTNLNTKNMLKYGTIATLSMFFIMYFFGMNNGMLAFPIALTAISLSFEDVSVKPVIKTIRLMLIDTAIITATFLASINPYIGIPINFVTIFLIAYFLTAKFNPKIYKPFMMLFVFTSFSKVSFNAYLTRLSALVVGVAFVIILTYITSRKTQTSIIKDSVLKPFIILEENINNILQNNFDQSLYDNFSKAMRGLCYKIYVTRYNKFLTTNIGRIQFDVYLSLERLNLYLYTLNTTDESINHKTLTLLHKSIHESVLALNEANDINAVLISLDSFVNNSLVKKEDLKNIIYSLKVSISKITNLNSKELNKPYSHWNRSNLESFKIFVPADFNLNSIRFRFSLRVATALTVTTFLGHMISLYKFIWVAITIMSVMQPYYEETISKGRDRIKGNVIGITLLVTLLHFSKDPYIAFITLIIGLYGTYGFKEYYKLSIFTSMASISVASLSTSLGEITLSRVSFILLGLLVVFSCNKFLFPYNIEKGVKSLTTKIFKYNLLLLEEANKLHHKDFNPNKFRDLVILNTLNSEKLILRNEILKNDKIKSIVNLNNDLTIKIAFDSLIKKI